MKNWGFKAFDNEHARDWATSLATANEAYALATIDGLFRTAGTRLLKLDELAVLQAAAGAICAAADPSRSAGVADEVLAWIRRTGYTPAEDDLKLCRQCVVLLKDTESAIAKYWAKSRKTEPWHEYLDQLVPQAVDPLGNVADRMIPPEYFPYLQHAYSPDWALAKPLKWTAFAALGLLLLQVIMELIDALMLSGADPAANPETLGLATYGWFYFVLYLLFRLAVMALLILFFTWIVRCHCNLPRLGSLGLGYRPPMAFGNFLIPVIGLYRPYNMVQDLYRASTPFSDFSNPVDWKQTRANRLIILWWALWIVNVVLSYLNGSFELPATAGALAGQNLTVLISDILLLTQLSLLAYIVITIQSRQEERFENLVQYTRLKGVPLTTFVENLAKAQGSGPMLKPGERNDSLPAARDTLRIEKFSFLAVTVLFPIAALYFQSQAFPKPDMGFTTMGFIVGTVMYLLVLWRVFFGDVHYEKWTCFGLAILFSGIAVAFIIGIKLIEHPAMLSFYIVFIALHIWLMTIMVRDARRWRAD